MRRWWAWVAVGCAPAGRPDVGRIGRLVEDGPLTLVEARDEGVVSTAPPADLTGVPDVALPAVIRVWRRGLDGSTDSCEGRVDDVPLEAYVASVLPHEWVATWHPEAVRAGAIAVRSYAVWWAAAGGRYPCADVDDTTWSQVYGGAPHPATDEATAVTAGVLVGIDGSLILAEYSAEHGGVGAWGVADPPCVGSGRRGHGRGMCQWGSQRWANEGWSAERILEHYYPGGSLMLPWEAEVAEVGPFEGQPTASAFVSVRNLGTASWVPGEVQLVDVAARATDERALWLDGRTAALVSETVPPGDTLWLEVPWVDPGGVADVLTLRLEGPNGDLFGEPVFVPLERDDTVVVDPARPDPPPRVHGGGRSRVSWALPFAAGLSVLVSAWIAWSGVRGGVR